MSIRAIAWVLEQEIKEPLEKYVLVILANYAGDTGLAYPSTETISRITSLSHRTVVRLLDRLVAQGWVEDSGKRTGRTKQVKVYRLSGAKPDSQSPLKTDSQSSFNPDSQAPLKHERVTPSPERVSPSPERVSPSHPDPLEEPLRNPKRNQLSKFIDFLIDDPRFDGLDVEAEVARAVEWYKKKNRPVTERLLENWLLHADQPLEEDEEEVGSLACEDYYSWEGWTEERRRALLELWPNTAEPPVRWAKMSPDIKEQIEARVKEGWPA